MQQVQTDLHRLWLKRLFNYDFAEAGETPPLYAKKIILKGANVKNEST